MRQWANGPPLTGRPSIATLTVATQVSAVRALPAVRMGQGVSSTYLVRSLLTTRSLSRTFAPVHPLGGCLYGLRQDGGKVSPEAVLVVVGYSCNPPTRHALRLLSNVKRTGTVLTMGRVLLVVGPSGGGTARLRAWAPAGLSRSTPLRHMGGTD